MLSLPKEQYKRKKVSIRDHDSHSMSSDTTESAIPTHTTQHKRKISKRIQRHRQLLTNISDDMKQNSRSRTKSPVSPQINHSPHRHDIHQSAKKQHPPMFARSRTISPPHLFDKQVTTFMDKIHGICIESHMNECMDDLILHEYDTEALIMDINDGNESNLQTFIRNKQNGHIITDYVNLYQGLCLCLTLFKVSIK